MPVQAPYRGLIAPHAGFTYSGHTAAHAYAWLAQAAGSVDLVVIFGSHRGPHGPNTVFTAAGWDTPLGPLTTAMPLAAQLQRDLKLAEEPVQPRHPDNAVELHLPFVRHFFPQAELLMLGVAAGTSALTIGQEVGDAVRRAGINAVFAGSTDLTHYGPNYDFAPAGKGLAAVEWVRNQNDRGVIDATLNRNATQVLAHAEQHQSACCAGAVAATIQALGAYGAQAPATLVEHTLSYDIVPNASFVGYAGIVL